MYSLDLVGFINHNANVEPDNVILANNNTVAISTISTNREINILDLESGNIKCRLEITNNDNLEIQYSKNGKVLLISSVDKGQFGIYRIDNTGCYFEANINQNDTDENTIVKLSGDGSTLVISGSNNNILYIYTKNRDWKIPYIIHAPNDDYVTRVTNDLVINYNATRIAMSINGEFCQPDNQGLVIIYDIHYSNDNISSIDSKVFTNPTPSNKDTNFIGSVFGVALTISDCGNRLAVTISSFVNKDEIVDMDNCVYVFSYELDWYFERCIEDKELINPYIGFQMAFDKSGDLFFVSDIQRDLKDENYLNLVRVYNRKDDAMWHEQDFIYQLKKEDPSILRLSQCDENIAIIFNNDNKVADIYQIIKGEREHPIVMH
jgi:WD40 repeat protein